MGDPFLYCTVLGLHGGGVGNFTLWQELEEMVAVYPTGMVCLVEHMGECMRPKLERRRRTTIQMILTRGRKTKSKMEVKKKRMRVMINHEEQ